MDLKFIKDKKILVTGGAGFIGSNICEKLIELGAIVYSLDNFSTGKSENIDSLINSSRFISIEGDIRDYKICKKSTMDIDYVLHHAAIGSVPRSIEDPIETNDINIGGFVNILKASVDNNVKRFIYAASSSTYGDSTKLPKFEDEIGEPLSPYALTKYANELYASVFSKTHKIEVIGLRYFNVYGKKQDINGPYAAVIPKFIYQLINYESPIINGDGSFTRDFTHVEDVIQMNLLALATKSSQAINQVYNTAFGESTTILELFDLIKAILTKYDKRISKVNVIFGDARPGDVPHSVASIEKAKQLLNYNPNVTTMLGLVKTVEWFYENINMKSNV
ncbi:MAG: SDR family oxidoreductase [Bacteroidota bacterium]|nr:SDR family oxidoreductase [Bacteroidota bacterium]